MEAEEVKNMKWAAFALIVLGFSFAVVAISEFKSASFEDGSFVLAILTLCVGAGLALGGVVWLAVLLFAGI